MKTKHLAIIGLAIPALGLLGTGCTTEGRVLTNQSQPGPAIGRAIGTGVGAVVGNATGLAVGAGEGLVGGAAVPFDTTTRVVRRWRTETTADGRTIQVPEDIRVDANGRPVGAPAKK